MALQCEMIVGYLVPHQCEHPALSRCVKCGRGYCEEHISIKPEGLLCLACEQGFEQPVLLPITAQTFSTEDFDSFSAASQWDEESDLFADLS